MFKNKIKGVLLFIFSLFFAYYTFSWHETLTSILPTTLLRVLYWIGYITLFLLCLFIVPVKMFAATTEQQYTPVGKAFGSFFLGIFFASIGYNVSNAVFGAILAMPDSSSVIDTINIASIAFYLITFLLMIGLPLYYALHTDNPKDNTLNADAPPVGL